MQLHNILPFVLEAVMLEDTWHSAGQPLAIKDSFEQTHLVTVNIVALITTLPFNQVKVPLLPYMKDVFQDILLHDLSIALATRLAERVHASVPQLRLSA
jgi:hypothetical protein